MSWLGVDTGGTFTDFVYVTGGQVRVHKVLSTPDAPERAILQGIGELNVSLDGLLLVHGSTVATNAVLEGKGVKTAYITNHGFADVLTIGRQARDDIYDLTPTPKAPPVPRELCWEVGGRLSATAELIEPLTDADLSSIQALCAEHQPQAIAINCLFSFLDDASEQSIASVIPESVYISRSAEVLPEEREYERGIATWLNSYVGPLMQGYLARLADNITPASLSVMQSQGLTADAEQAGRKSVQLLLSGPAGGLAAAKSLASAVGEKQLLTFDMGGTSTDVALIEGDIALTSEGKIAGYPVAVPMVDMHTIGAGGGSIAWLDEGGLLHVGPESAGASPGPACYGKGGVQATVTDANVVLGYLPHSSRLGGHMSLDIDASFAAVDRLAEHMRMSREEVAQGIIQLANEHMAQALRVISVSRGYDPAEFALMPFGGAGGLHVCALADALGMRRIVIPPYGGVFSALGMLLAPKGRHLRQTYHALLDELDAQELLALFKQMREQIDAELAQEGEQDVVYRQMLSLRYQGQSSTIDVSWDNVPNMQQEFHTAHRKRFGHALEIPIECVHVVVHAKAADPKLPLNDQLDTGEQLIGSQSVYGVHQPVSVYPREALPGSLSGPALIREAVATTYLAAGWQLCKAQAGCLLFERTETI